MPPISPTVKRVYVFVMRVIRWPLKRTGLLQRFGGPRSGRWCRWLRSLFAIHDIDDMIALDLPWWTFDAIARTEAFLAARPTARVFEYGSGASTVWLSHRAQEVISTEHDETWHRLVRSRLPASAPVTLNFVPPEANVDPDYRSDKPGWRTAGFRHYAQAIDRQSDRFDLIVIDGRARAACLRHAAMRLAPGGMILFDNSGRTRYRLAIEASGLSSVQTRGLTPGLPYPDQTTLIAADPAVIPPGE